MLLSTAVHSSTPSSCNDCCQVEVTQCLCTSTSYSPTSKHTTITLICPVFHSLHQNDVIHTIHHLSHTVLVVVQKVFFFHVISIMHIPLHQQFPCASTWDYVCRLTRGFTEKLLTQPPDLEHRVWAFNTGKHYINTGKHYINTEQTFQTR